VTAVLGPEAIWHAPGYMPSERRLRDLLKRAVGVPNLLKRLQMGGILSALALKPHEVALDFGCGQGYMTYEMAWRCRKAYGLDVLENKRFVPARLADRIAFVTARGERTPFSNETFDVILMSEVVPMIDEPLLFFKEVTRILKPAGRIVLVNPLDRRGIHRDYETGEGVVGVMRALGLAPRDYDEYTARLQESFGTALRHLPAREYYERVLADCGFTIHETTFSPSAAAQSLYERLQFVLLCLGRRTYGRHHFALYPIFKFIDALRPEPRGTGCIMVARRIAHPSDA
jgi:ubiquinone/menaquinone biosynthesis C-methylase UbiE